MKDPIAAVRSGTLWNTSRRMCSVVVGLYLKPPDNPLVMWVDEKSQIQALDCTEPGLPLKKGRCGTTTPGTR